VKDTGAGSKLKRIRIFSNTHYGFNDIKRCNQLFAASGADGKHALP